MLKVVELTPPDTEVRLTQIAHELERTQKNAILEMGKLLCEARDLFKYKRDEEGFRGWLVDNCSISRSSAYEAISVFERFGKNVSAAADTLPHRTLRELAAPSTPEPVRSAALERVERGEKLTLDTVKEMKAAAKQAEEEQKLSARKRQNLKAKREAEEAAEAKREAAATARHERRMEASKEAVAIVIATLGDRLATFQNLLREAYAEDFYNGLLRA